jgi:hypothetical protein
MDWNPFHSSLFTGAGTPWGAMEYGKPDAPKFSNDPNQFQGFNSSSLRDALNQSIRRGAAANRAASLAAAQKGGALSSGQMQTGLGGVSAQQAEQENLMNANLARQDWMDKVAAMDRYNQQQMAKYAIDKENFDSEQKGRGEFWGNVGKIAGTVGGGLLGGPAGAAVGSSLFGGGGGGGGDSFANAMLMGSLFGDKGGGGVKKGKGTWHAPLVAGYGE